MAVVKTEPDASNDVPMGEPNGDLMETVGRCVTKVLDCQSETLELLGSKGHEARKEDLEPTVAAVADAVNEASIALLNAVSDLPEWKSFGWTSTVERMMLENVRMMGKVVLELEEENEEDDEEEGERGGGGGDVDLKVDESALVLERVNENQDGVL